jgi:hypothetical protein
MAKRLLALLLMSLTLGSLPAIAMAAGEDAEMGCDCPCCHSHGRHKCMCGMREHRLMLAQSGNQPIVTGPGCHCEQGLPGVASTSAITMSAMSMAAPLSRSIAALWRSAERDRDGRLTLDHTRAPPIA